MNKRSKNLTPADLDAARRPIASLIGKSEKAQQKLTPGTWQHTMLRDNLKALHIASSLMSDKQRREELTLEDLRDAMNALATMIKKAERECINSSVNKSHRRF